MVGANLSAMTVQARLLVSTCDRVTTANEGSLGVQRVHPHFEGLSDCSLKPME